MPSDNTTAINCDFDNDAMTCPVCGFKAGGRDWRKNCRVASKLPPMRERLANFTLAAIRHATSGMPTCTDEQIAERISVCRGCDKFLPEPSNPEIGACTECGCPVSDQLSKFVSKIAWADQRCPLEKW